MDTPSSFIVASATILVNTLPPRLAAWTEKLPAGGDFTLFVETAGAVVARIDGVDHPVDFVDGEHFGEVKSGDGCFEQERGIVVEISRDYQNMEDSADARYDAFAG